MRDAYLKNNLNLIKTNVLMAIKSECLAIIQDIKKSNSAIL